MNISKIRENARTALTGKWGKGVIITLAYFVFAFVVELLIEFFGEKSLMGQLLDIANSIIEIPITLGLGYAFIKLKRNEDVKAFDFLKLSFSNFGRAWKISLRKVLKLIIPLIGMYGGVILFLGGIFAAGAVANGAKLGTGFIDILISFAGIVLVFVSIIWFVAKALLYSLTVYIAYDNPNMSSLEVVNESSRMMKGNRWKIFILDLSFIGWAILAVCTFGIGCLWLLPYMQVAIVCFYEHLLGKNEVISNEEENVEAIKEM